jgi:hypothetical protein
VSITARPGDDPGAGNSILAPYKPGGVLSLYLSDGLEAGLPRPRIDGRPVPWITPIGPNGLPEWRKVDPLRVLACQTDWLCQVCGLELPRRAWVVLEAGRVVLSDTAVHRACLSMSWRWCPHVANPQHELDAVEVTWAHIMADGERYDLITNYGDVRRTWTVPRP